MEFTNKRPYSATVIVRTVPLMIAFAAMLFLRPDSLTVSAIVFLILLYVIVSEKYTENILLLEDVIVIDYWRFFAKAQIRVSYTDIDFELTRAVAYMVLKLVKQDKSVYAIKSKDGFEEKLLQHIYEVMQKRKAAYTNSRLTPKWQAV